MFLFILQFNDLHTPIKAALWAYSVRNDHVPARTTLWECGGGKTHVGSLSGSGTCLRSLIFGCCHVDILLHYAKFW